MNWHLANPALIAGLIGVAIPIIIHLLNRRRSVVIDWGAMQFLELGRRARRKIQLTEILLMLVRMTLLALVALAVARPFWTPAQRGSNAVQAASATRRDVVLVLDGSDSMGRRLLLSGDGATTPRERALAWARQFVEGLAPGDSVAVLDARDRVRPIVVPASFDRKKVDEALASAPAPRGSSDLAAGVAEGLRLLGETENPAREVIVLTDGQKHPWRTEEPGRWTLIRDLHASLRKHQSVEAPIWAVTFGSDQPAPGADGSVEAIELARGLVPPGLPLTVRATVANAGPGELTRTAELLIDGRAVPGSARAVGPIPPGSKTNVAFQASLAQAGSHLLGVRLAPDDDPLVTNDQAARPVEVAEALGVLLIDGEPGIEPLTGETDFLRAALAPRGDDTPQVKTTVVPASSFAPEMLEKQLVAVLANVERLGPEQAGAIARFVAEGGGVLVAPGDRTDANFFNEQLFRNGSGWLPAALGELKGDPKRRQVVAHPAPASFVGPTLAPFGQGDAPPLAEADLFFYRILSPATRSPAAAVMARLDTGDPWIVERPYRKGRVALLAGPIDAEGGTLPVNPDFVPWAHELIYHLADPDPGARDYQPGESISIDLDSDLDPDSIPRELPVEAPGGSKLAATVDRSRGRLRATLASADEPGIYRFVLPEPPGGSIYVAVNGDPGESDPRPLAEGDRKAIASGWPLRFMDDPADADALAGIGGPALRHPIWRWLVLAALGGLCLEVWMTRRLVRDRGLAPLVDDDAPAAA